MDWIEHIQERKSDVIKDTQALLRHKSVLDESTATETRPFGEGIDRTYRWLLDKAKADGFTTKDIGGYAGHIEYGEGDELVGILCHIDVVPEGDGWSKDPYGAEIADGKIIARGAIDDKGPTMAAYHALKLVKDLNLPLSKRVRLIIGTDEESQWRCVDKYFKEEEMPVTGFAPDADFPIIYSEKGICDIQYSQSVLKEQPKDVENTLVRFSSGHRLNMVPEKGEAVVKSGSPETMKTVFEEYLVQEQLQGKTSLNKEHQLVLTVQGKSVHGMEPNKGINGGLELARFLNRYHWDEQGGYFLELLAEKFARDSRGKSLGIHHINEELGDLTLNLGVLNYDQNNGGKIGVNLRYPKGVIFTDVKKTLDKILKAYRFDGSILTHEEPHMVNEDSPLIQTLSSVYEEQTGLSSKLLAIGGGTYARSLNEGVAFGPLFPHREDVAHQPDEAIHIEDLLKATSIHAQAIYELAK